MAALLRRARRSVGVGDARCRELLDLDRRLDGLEATARILHEADWPVRLGTGVIINLTPWFHAMGCIGSLSVPLVAGVTIVLLTVAVIVSAVALAGLPDHAVAYDLVLEDHVLAPLAGRGVIVVEHSRVRVRERNVQSGRASGRDRV